MTTTHLSTAERRRAARTLGRAFARDPLMTYVFPDETTRRRVLPRLFAPMLRCCARYGGVELEADGDGVGGVAAWLAGKHFPLGVWHLIHSGMIATPLQGGSRGRSPPPEPRDGL